MSSNNSFQVFEGGWKKTASAIHTENIITLATTPLAFFIRPDGTELFTIEGTIISTRPLSVPWDVDSAGSVTNTFNVVNEDSSPHSLFFKDDGSKMFVLGSDSSDIIQYDVPTNWNIGTASFEDLNILSGISNPLKIFFSRDGDFLYLVDPFAGIVYRFEVPTPWDIGTLNNLTSFNPGLSNVLSISVKPEGDKMFLAEATSKQIIEYALSPDYSLSSPTVGNSLTISQLPTDIFFRGTGSQVFVEDATADTITRFELEIEWDIPTASFFTNNLPVTDQPRAIFWKPDGTKFFDLDLFTDVVRAHDITPNGTPFNTNNLTLLPDTFSVLTQTSLPVGMFWSPDGSLLFILGNDEVFKYSTSVPFSIEPADITATPIQTFELNGINSSTGIWFSPDGNIMLISSANNPRKVSQFDLSAAYVLPPDLQNADKTLSLPGGDNVIPQDLFLKPDGLQMFLTDAQEDSVARYVITTPLIPNNQFSILTAVLADKLDLTSFMPNPQGLSMSNDGKKIFVSDITDDEVLTFDTV